jgi:hypothetical protein
MQTRSGPFEPDKKNLSDAGDPHESHYLGSVAVVVRSLIKTVSEVVLLDHIYGS